MALTTAQKIGVSAAAVLALIIMAKCDTDSSVNQPSSTPSVVVTETVDPADDTGDYLTDDSTESNQAMTELALEMAWSQGTDSNHADMCLLWVIDPDTAMTYFNEGLENDSSDFNPDPDQVRDFFDQKCAAL